MKPPVKKDLTKAKWSLFPWDGASKIVEVLTFGSKKYSRHGWEQGGGYKYSVIFDAAMRHMAAWWQREPYDKESGLSHLAHAACCTLFLLTYEARGMTKEDDRPKLRRK